MSKETKEMMKRLVSTIEYEEFYETNRGKFIDISLSEYLLEVMAEKDLTAAQIAKSTGTGDYLYKLLNGKKKNPSRDVLIRLAFGMKMNAEEISNMMRITHFHELDSRNKRDAAILFCINKSYDLQRTNEMLYELQLQTLEK